jgi:hypothetical protein
MSDCAVAAQLPGVTADGDTECSLKPGQVEAFSCGSPGPILGDMTKNEGEPADVVILGAGFSAAVNGELPLANPLGNLAYARAWPPSDGASDGVRPYSQDHPFEAALSLLAETQPHLTEAENRRNALSFAELNEAVAGVLDDAQQRAFNVDAPPWLYELLSVLHERRATIVTLNYDTGIETGVETHWLIPDPARVPDLTAPARRTKSTGERSRQCLQAMMKGSRALATQAPSLTM